MKHKRKSQLQSLNNILGGGVSRRGLRKSVKASLICFWAGEVLQELFQQKATKMTVASYANSSLKLRCADAFIATMAKMRETQILEKLNEKCGRKEVKRIRFEIGEEKTNYSNWPKKPK